MTAIYAGSASSGGTSGTSNRTASVTPVIGELLVVVSSMATNTNTAPTCSDNRSGTYYFAGFSTWATSTNTMAIFVRNQPVGVASSHTVTVATGANDAGVVGVVRVSGMSRFGSSAVRQFNKTDNGASGSAPTFSFSQSCLTGNVTIVAAGSADTTTTSPTSWTERIDANQATPTIALEIATRDSGFTSTTVTWGATQSTTWGALGIELDCSALSFIGSYPTSDTALTAALGSVVDFSGGAGYLLNEASGDASAVFGSPSSLTATNLTYGTTGMLPGEKAVGFTSNSADKLDGGNVFDPGALDTAILIVYRLNSRPGAITGLDYSVARKRDNGSALGWSIEDATGFINFTFGTDGGSVSPQAPYSGSNEWVIVLAIADQAASTTSITCYAPSAGFFGGRQAGSTWTTASNTHNLIIGYDGTNGAADMDVDAFYINVGSGIASGASNSACNALYQFVNSLLVASANHNGLMLMGVG